MIVTLTANPSLDRTVALPGPLLRGEVQRAVSVRQESGGKGVNVSRALVASGLTTVAVLPGAEADPVLAGLREGDVPFAALPIGEPLRSNVALTEPGGVTTKINEPGPVLSADQQEALIGLLLDRSRGASWVVLAGSLPPGVPADFYATVTRRLRSMDHGNEAPLIAVDSSGEPLAAAISGDALGKPDLLKPNAEELVELAAAAGFATQQVRRGTRSGSGGCRGGRRRRRAFRSGCRAGNARLQGCGACDGRRRVAGHASAGHCGQHGRRRRFLAGRLPARLQPGRRPGRLPPSGGGPWCRRRFPAGLHSPGSPPNHPRCRNHHGPPEGLTVTQLITTELVELDQNLGSSPEDVIRHLAGRVAANGRATEVEGLFADAFARESKTATGVPGGIAIPHCRSTAVTEPTLAMARLSQPVDFGAKDGPADLIFFIAAPEGADQEHLKLLSKLARSLIKKDFTAALRAAGSRGRGRRARRRRPRGQARGGARPQQPPPAHRGRTGRRRTAPASGRAPSASSPSPPAPPASPTPTWPPIRSWPRPRKSASTCRWRPRGPPAPKPLTPP